MNSLFDMSGRAAIVTGGTRGIGQAIAMGLAEAGSRVVITGRSREVCEAAAAEIADRTGQEVVGIAAEMSDLERLPDLVATTVDRFGRLEVLVNNVAIAEYVDLDNIDLETVDKIFRVNIMAPLTLSSAAVKYMAAAGAGSIINVSGSTAFLARPNNAVYVASKAAMQSFTRSCAAKWADVGIRVNSLVPGLIDTEMSASVTPEQRAHALAIGILKREGRPDELTGGALYLASDASSYVTGQTLMVDGGMVLR